MVIADGVQVKPLLGFSVTREGGLMAFLAPGPPIRTFRYGVLDMPAGEGSVDATLRRDEASTSTEVAPKLHLHRSGWLSLDSTERLERRAIHTQPLDEHGEGHLHRFSFIARHPHRWSSVDKRESDIVLTVNGPPATTVTVLGHIGPLENFKPGMPPGDANPWVDDLILEDGTLQPTGIAIVEREQWSYYLWLTFKPNAPFGDGPDPSVILYGFDPHTGADQSTSAEMLAVWSLAE